MIKAHVYQKSRCGEPRDGGGGDNEVPSLMIRQHGRVKATPLGRGEGESLPGGRHDDLHGPE
jgi:hypothetical protein